MRAAHSGFTLFEVVAVIVIIGVLGVFAAGRMDIVDADGWAFRQAIASAARSARHIAQDSGCAVRFSVSASGDHYVAHYRDGAGGSACGTGSFAELVPDGAGGNLAGSAPPGVDVVAGDTVTFDGTGSLAGPAGTIRVSGAVPIGIAASGYVHDG